MKCKLTRISQPLLLSLVACGATIIPMTSAVAILPMSSEIFQTETPTVSTETMLTVEDALSKANNLKRENEQLTAFSSKSKFATLIRESKQFKDIEKHDANIWHE